MCPSFRREAPVPCLPAKGVSRHATHTSEKLFASHVRILLCQLCAGLLTPHTPRPKISPGALETSGPANWRGLETHTHRQRRPMTSG
jgi:hypothetical protein